jgi:hypothetical protein
MGNGDGRAFDGHVSSRNRLGGMRMRVVVLITTILTMMGGAAAAQACTTTWHGPGGTTANPTSGDWGDPTNWSEGTQPDASDDACITGAGTYTVTLAPYGGTHYGETSGASVNTLTLGGGSGTQTLDVVGEGAEVQGNWYNETFLGLDNGMSVGAHGAVILDATGNNANSTTGTPVGGSAALIFTTTAQQPFENAGTITAESSDSQWGESMNFGATLTNTGTINTTSGKMTFQGGSPEMIINNTGTVGVAAGASMALTAGDGSSFTNDGTFTNAGSTTVSGSMHFVQSGGSESGNPIQLQSGTTLDDSAGNASFLFNLGAAYLTGTIPSGQTIGVQGTTYNCSGNQCSTSTLVVGGNVENAPSVTNHGTIHLDAPGSGTTSGGNAYLAGGKLINDGTLSTSVEDSNWVADLNGPVTNAHGGTITIGGKTVSNSTVINDGTITIAPGSLYQEYGGNVSNKKDGTLKPEISSASKFGSFDLKSGTFVAGGKINPTVTGGYKPKSGKEFELFTLDGGTFSGKFGSVGNSFAADYRHTSSTPPYVGVVYAGGPAPRVLSLSGGAGGASVKLSCAKGGGCAPYSITGTVTELLKGKKQVVTVATASGHVPAGKTIEVSLKLNKAGEALISRSGRLKAQVTVTENGKKLRAASITITKSRRK